MGDQILVRYRKGTTTADRARVGRAYGLTRLQLSANGRTDLVVAKGRSAAAARAALAADPSVEAVSPNYQRFLTADPTGEHFFDQEWGLNNTGQDILGVTGTAGADIDGLQGINLGTGDPSIVVAVIDNGVDFTHPDLVARRYTNPGESGGGKETDGIDNDGNGLIDDVHGWDFCHNDNNPSPVNNDFHGTHVAGTIAASLDGAGVVGVAPSVTILSLKALEGNTSCSEAALVDAIDYVGALNAAGHPVQIINASWGGPGFDQVMDDAIRDSGALFVAAAGNNGLDMDASSANRFYPAVSAQPNVLSVAAIDQNGELAGFSNFGHTLVDIAAPGVSILSTVPPQPAQGGQPACPAPCFAYLDGTSMAAPHVAGVAALALSRKLPGTYSPSALRSHILASGRAFPSTAGLTATGRVVNAYRASDVVAPVAAAPDRFTLRPGSRIGTSTGTALVRWPAATDDLTGVISYAIRRFGPTGWSTLGTGIKPTSKIIASTITFAKSYRFSVTATDLVANVSLPAETVIKASLYGDATSLAAYSSGWSTAASSGASGGKVHVTTRRGASVTLSFTGRGVSIVSPTGPTRGSYRVYLDGVYAATVSERSSSAISRVVTYSVPWSTSGAHKLKVVVVGTAGHPRVDVDAFVVIR